LIADLRKKVATKLGVEAAVLSCFEAGRDGFWLPNCGAPTPTPVPLRIS
jgi:hypothetical protein